MYANRRGSGKGIDPRSATIALVLNGAVVAALIFAAPEMVRIRTEPPLTTSNIPIQPPPKPLPKPKPVGRSATNPAPRPIPQPSPIVVATPTLEIGPITFTPVPSGPSDGTGMATGTATATPTPTPLPAVIGPSVDPRYADDLQPAYPPEETRAGREGRVVVRVLVGIDGRVKQVEQTSATSDAFWRATQRQALSRWRFHPATQGGVPVEAWRMMAIRFVLRG